MTRVWIFKLPIFNKKALKVAQKIAYFCKIRCWQDLFKIDQTGHTALDESASIYTKSCNLNSNLLEKRKSNQCDQNP